MGATFFQSQLDYIFFFYGLAFILLVPVCRMLSRKPPPQPVWAWLGWFGLAHGVNEWLDLVALVSGSNPPLDIARFALMSLSFIFLMEFGRLSLVSLRGKGPGRWILAPFLAFALLGGLAGPAGLFASARYSLGLTGALWAAAALYLASRLTNLGAPALKGASLAMAVYALATGLVVPPAPFFPATLINYETFLAVTGLPIILVRAFMAVAVSICLWLFARAYFPEELDRRTRRLSAYAAIGTAGGLILLLAGGWVLTEFLGRHAYHGERTEQEQYGKLIKKVLIDKEKQANQLVRVMAGSPAVVAALISREPQALRQADAVLDRYHEALPSSVCYLLDLRGITLASSNRAAPDSFVGKNYALRPYFQEAVADAAGRYFALGLTSRERGYYAAHPVRDPVGKVLGVAVVKRSLEGVEPFFPEPGNAFVIDPHGIVFLSNSPEMVLKSLWPLSPEAVRELAASRQFGAGPFPPILAREPVDGSEITFRGERLAVVRQPLDEAGWSLVLLASTPRMVSLHRLLGILTTLLMCLGLLGGVTVLDQTVTSARRIAASEIQYRSLVEGAPNCVSLFDGEGRFLAINQNGLETLGRTAEELLGRRFPDLWPEASRPLVEAAVQEVIVGQKLTFEAEWLHPAGHSIILQVVLNPIREGDAAIRRFVGIATDITAPKRAQEALVASEANYRAIFNAANEAIVIHDPQTGEILDVNRKMREMYGYLREEASHLTVEDISSGEPPYTQVEALEWIRKAAAGEPQLFEWLCKDRAGRLFWVEVNLKRAVIGGNERVLAMVRDITPRKQAEEELRQSFEKLRRTLENTVGALAAALDKRDPYTAGHQRHVADLACAISRRLGLSRERCEWLRLAALVHNIGTLNVPTEILVKPGKLSHLEMGLIQCHPEVGHDILKDVDFPGPLAQIVLQHHERLDGSGYPQGLKSEEILLEARILAVADVVEAMNSHRPFRPALGVEAAVAEITQKSGIIYDPEVVAACLEVLREKDGLSTQET